MAVTSNYFLRDYATSRARFRTYPDVLRRRWTQVEQCSHAVGGDPDLTIDWLWAESEARREKLLVFTTGEHGIEGYVGSGMLQRFMDTCLARLDPQTTGLLLVHAINPWGMANFRRTNAYNVDLNRNFVYYPAQLDPQFNPAFDRLEHFLHPRRPLGNLGRERLAFTYLALGWRLRLGSPGFWGTVWLGQYRHPKALHYGGDQLQEETRVMMELYRQALQRYPQVLQLDMHTGYGPREQMSLVNSALDERSSTECARLYDYPLVVAANPEEFYAISGDMMDYVYALRQAEFPDRRLYATSFEFGTYGESTAAKVRSRRAMSFENQVYWYGAVEASVRAQVADDFLELFYPQAPDWQAKAVADADQAFAGILKAEGYFQV